jgi:hypothetical protein
MWYTCPQAATQAAKRNTLHPVCTISLWTMVAVNSWLHKTSSFFYTPGCSLITTGRQLLRAAAHPLHQQSANTPIGALRSLYGARASLAVRSTHCSKPEWNTGKAGTEARGSWWALHTPTTFCTPEKIPIHHHHSAGAAAAGPTTRQPGHPPILPGARLVDLFYISARVHASLVWDLSTHRHLASAAAAGPTTRQPGHPPGVPGAKLVSLLLKSSHLQSGSSALTTPAGVTL